MNLSVEKGRDGQLHVRIEGDLNFDTVPEARKRLLRTARTGGFSTLELDCSRISSMDTSAVAMLVEVLRCVSQAGHAFRLKEVKEDQKRLLRLARLSQVFGIDDKAFLESV